MSRRRSIRKRSVRAQVRAGNARCFSEPLEARVLLSTVLIQGTSGDDTINVFTGRDYGAIGAPYTINWTINGGPSQSQIVHSGDSVDIKTSIGADTVNIQKTLAGIPTVVEGDSEFPPDDTLNIGDSNGVQDIAGSITLGFGNWQINVNDQGDTAARTATVNYDPNRTPRYAVTGLAPAAIDAGASFNARGLTIQTDAVPGNVVNVLQVDQVPTTVVGNAQGTLNVQYPSFNDPLGISKLTLSNPSSPWSINFDDSSVDPFSRKPTFDSGSLTFPGDTLSPTYWNPGEVHSIAYNTSPATGSVVAVTAVAGTTSLSINGTGLDTVKIGGGNVQNVAGSVSVSSGFMGNLVLVIDDSADTAARGPSIFENANGIQLTGLAPGTIGWQPDKISVTIDGGSGGNTFAITALPLTSPVNPPSFVINTGSGNDSVLMNYATGQVLGNVSLDGQAGSNMLIVVGSGPTDHFGVTPTTITHLGQATTYSNFNVMVLDPAMFTVSGDLGGMDLSVVGDGTTVQLQGDQHLGKLMLDGGVRVSLAGGAVGMPTSSLSCGIIVIAATATLDLGNNVLLLPYRTAADDPVATVRSYVSGGQITSPMQGAKYRLGLTDSADLGPTAGLPVVKCRLTVTGDTNLDGTVDFGDLLSLAQNYGQSNRNWDQGDMNYDGSVSFSDLLSLAQNYGELLPAVTPLPAVSVAAAMLPDPLLSSRRRR